MTALMKELARRAPRTGAFNVFFVGGGTAVYLGWRRSSIDVDVYSDQDIVFRDIQEIKEQLNMNIEFARPEDFVPPLPGTTNRHVFIEKIGAITFFHYDPYAQVLSKLVRGFRRDMEDARQFVHSGMIDLETFRKLVSKIPDSAFAKYPGLSRSGVDSAVDAFVGELG